MLFLTNRLQAYLRLLLQGKPAARAQLRGSRQFPRLRGTLWLYPVGGGTLAAAEVSHLPVSQETCAPNIFALHIHQGASCSGTAEDPFANTAGHFNPEDCPHPAHAGDLPPLFADRKGFACMAVYTDRFQPQDVVGRTIVVHSGVDDFKTQPAGAAGSKIACGEIYRT